MKLNERYSFEDKMFHIQQQHDVTETLKRAEKMRHAREIGHNGSIPDDWEPIAVVPGIMRRLWAQEAGIRMDDAEAMDELLRKKLIDGQFGKFRISDRNL